MVSSVRKMYTDRYNAISSPQESTVLLCISPNLLIISGPSLLTLNTLLCVSLTSAYLYLILYYFLKRSIKKQTLICYSVETSVVTCT